MNLSKTIVVPSTGETRNYDGRIPEPLDIRDGNINYTDTELQTALDTAQIDMVSYNFLLRLLEHSKADNEVLQEVLRYREAVTQGLQPGLERFIQMQELGLKHHPDLDPTKGLDISGYELPKLNLNDAIINSPLTMNGTIIRGNAQMADMMTAGSVYMKRAQIHGDLIQERDKINGFLRQDDFWVKGNFKARNIIVAKNISQIGGRILGDADLENGQVLGQVVQQGLHVGGDLIESGLSTARGLYLFRAHIKGNLIRRGAIIGGRLDENEMNVEGKVIEEGSSIGFGQFVRSTPEMEAAKKKMN